MRTVFEQMGEPARLGEHGPRGIRDRRWLAHLDRKTIRDPGNYGVGRYMVKYVRYYGCGFEQGQMVRVGGIEKLNKDRGERCDGVLG